MTYRLTWINHWGEKRQSNDPQVIIRYTRQDYDQIEHEYNYYFDAHDDELAKRRALNYIEASTDEIEIWSVYNRETKTVILTEEDA